MYESLHILGNLSSMCHIQRAVPRFVLLASFGVRIPKGNWTKSGKITAAELTSATLVCFFCSTIAFVAFLESEAIVVRVVCTDDCSIVRRSRRS